MNLKDKSLEELSLEELEKLRRKSEIDKNEAERREIEKRLNRKWYVSDISVRILGGLVAIALIVAWAASVLLPLTQTTERLGKAKLELAKFEKAKADSLLNRATRKQIVLQKQAQLITTHLDSTTKRDQGKLALLNDTLKKEQAKSQRDQKKINELEREKLALQEDIKRSQFEKEQFKKIAGLVPVDVVLEEILVINDGPGGRVEWDFSIFINGNLVISINPAKYDEGENRGVYRDRTWPPGTTDVFGSLILIEIQGRMPEKEGGLASRDSVLTRQLLEKGSVVRTFEATDNSGFYSAKQRARMRFTVRLTYRQ